MNALEILKALANDTRFEILRMLHTRDLCVCELEVALGLAQSKISYHLSALKDAELVKVTQDGRWGVYSLERTTLFRLGGMVLETLSDAPDLSHVPDCRTLEGSYSQQITLMKGTVCDC
jgi:ArsR family transcriptional regulator, arsenate/arsenite/antimonite-responsive transcriptional repressor